MNRPQVIDGRAVSPAGATGSPPTTPAIRAEAFDWKQWEQITRMAAQKAREGAAAKRTQCIRLEQEIADLEATAKRLEKAIGVATMAVPARRGNRSAIREAIDRWADEHGGLVRVADFALSVGTTAQSLTWRFSGRGSLVARGAYERAGRGVYRRVTQ